MSESGPNDESRWILVFDGKCGFCRRSVEWVRTRDRNGQIEPVPFQSDRIGDPWRGVPRDAFEGAMHLFAPDGRVWPGARAGEQILRLLPRWRLLAPLFGIPGARPLADRVYRWIAGNRHRIGCGEHCEIG